MEKDSRLSALQKTAHKYALLDFSEKIKLSAYADELDDISTSVNTLADKLLQSLANEKKLGHELKQAALAAKQSEQHQLLFSSIVNLSDDAIISKDLNGNITSWNSGAQKLFGYNSGEVTGKHISILIPATLQNEETEIMNKIKSGQNIDHYETDRITKHGNIVHVSLTISPVKDTSGRIIGAAKICRDITRQKKAEADLQKTSRLYAFLSAINKSILHIADEQQLLRNACNIATQIGGFESVRIGLLDEAGRLNMINNIESAPGPENLQRYSGTDFSSHLLRDTPTGRVLTTGHYAISNDAQNDPDLSPWRTEMANNGIQSCASFPLKKFGKVVGVCSFLCTQVHFFDEKEIALLQESADDISFALEVIEKDKLRKKAEAEIKLLNDNLELKIAERTAQLQFANKELESFSYSVAHDLRSPLRGISGYASILHEDYNTVLDDEGKRLLAEVKNSAKKMGQLIDELLTFSKIGRKELRKIPVDMNQVVSGVINDITAVYPHSAKITVADLLPVLADEGLIKHVVVNLMANAIKYSSKKPAPVIQVSSAIKDGQVVYSIADNGVGFDMQYANKLFGVFQRLHTDAEFEGTGVGLAIAQRIVLKHGGHIWAQAVEGQGATFYFSLPQLTQQNPVE